MTTIHIDLNDSLVQAMGDKLSARGVSVSEAVQQWLEGFATEPSDSPSAGRYETELVEDEERWQRYQDTGLSIQHNEMIEWVKTLEERAKKFDDG